MTDEQRAQWLERLDASRRRLLVALDGVTERDFTTRLPPEAGDPGYPDDGPTVVVLLAAVALEERREIAAERGEAFAGRLPEKPLPPQAMHDLAGARYQSRRLVSEAAPAVAEALVSRIEQRDAAAARRILDRPRTAPPPVIPVVQP